MKKPSEPKSALKIKTLLVNIVLCFAAVLISLFAAEYAIRLLYKDKIVLFPRYHTDVQYGAYRIRRVRPNIEYRHTSPDGSWKYKINEQGYRSVRNFNYKKEPDTIRIICLGDSHTHGYEVRQDKTFSSVIERYLNANGLKAEVFNFGISGFSTAEELVFLENEGIKYSSDFVILAFYANDPQDNIKASLFRLENGVLVKNKTEHLPGVKIQNIIYKFSLLRWLGENSYFYSLLFNRTWEHYKKLLYSKEKAISEYATKVGDFTSYEINLTAHLIKRMYSFCKSHSITLIVVDIPQVNGRYDFKTSVPQELSSVIRTNSDIFIGCDQVLGEYRGAAEFHLPNGAQHISEFSHFLFGWAIAQEIAAFYGT